MDKPTGVINHSRNVPIQGSQFPYSLLKVGDRVKVVVSFYMDEDRGLFEGMEGVVVSIVDKYDDYATQVVGVRVFEEISGLDLGGLVSNTQGIYMYDFQLQKIE